ncbi:MAG TPA: response regulator, partial [Polyangiaceae bacterium]|nr:response regulator [Polyangiaceae bacterium]
MSSANQSDAEAQAISSRREPGSAPAPKLGARHSILIADDSKVIRNRLVSILESLDGVELRVAVDGLEALSLAKERKPDLLLCDHE